MSSESNFTLGEFLRHERERRGITIEQVASATKIGIKLLHALEADQYADLPAKPFIRGFVTSYSRFVGLDAREILTRFGEFIDKRAQDRPVRDSGHSGYAFEKKEGDQSRTILGFVMMGFLVIGGVMYFLLKSHLPHKHGTNLDRLRDVHASGSPSPAAPAGLSESFATAVSGAPMAQPGPSAPPSRPEPSPVASTPAPSPVAPAPSPSPSPTASASPAAAPSPSPSPKTSDKDPLSSGADLKPSETKHKVIVKAIESLFVRYQVDSKPVNQFILRKERILVLRAHDAIRLQVSNPNSVTFNYNGQGTHPVVDSEFTVSRQNDATLFFPPETAETIQEPFPGAKPLSGRKVPQPAASPALSTPEQ